MPVDRDAVAEAMAFLTIILVGNLLPLEVRPGAVENITNHLHDSAAQVKGGSGLILTSLANKLLKAEGPPTQG